MKVGVYYYHLLELGNDPSRQRTVQEFFDNAWRFRATYDLFPGGVDHTLTIVFLRGNITEQARSVWSGVNCRFEHYVPKDSDGWCSQACQEQVEKTDCDFMVNCVSRCYFHKSGWLKRLVNSREQFGDGIYGTMASDNGCPLGTHPHPNPHLRGSILAFDPKTFSTFPHKITSPEEEYKLECGEWNISNWYESNGKPALLVTFDGVWNKREWFSPNNAFHKGDQSNLLNWDRHTDLFAGVG